MPDQPVGRAEMAKSAPGGALKTTKKVCAAYEQRTLQKGFEKFNPSASEQVPEIEAEQARRRRGTG